PHAGRVKDSSKQDMDGRDKPGRASEEMVRHGNTPWQKAGASRRNKFSERHLTNRETTVGPGSSGRTVAVEARYFTRGTRQRRMNETDRQQRVARSGGKPAAAARARSPTYDASLQVRPTATTSSPQQAGLKGRTNRGRPPFECIALVLQGGGALGAY